MRRIAVTGAVCVALFLAGCAERTSAADRTVAIEVHGCGFANDTTGTGIWVGADLVLSAGHVVSRADSIVVTGPSGFTELAEVIEFDAKNDLALLRVARAMDFDRPQFDSASAGETVRVVDITTDLSVQILRELPVRIQEVRGTERNTRNAYELDVTTTAGQSGAGVWNADGHLVAVVFGHLTDDSSLSYATAADVVMTFLETAEMDRAWECSSERSALEPVVP